MDGDRFHDIKLRSKVPEALVDCLVAVITETPLEELLTDIPGDRSVG